MQKYKLEKYADVARHLQKEAFLAAAARGLFSLARIGANLAGKASSVGFSKLPYGLQTAVKSYVPSVGFTSLLSATQADPNDPSKGFFSRFGEALVDPRTYLAAAAFSFGLPVVAKGTALTGRAIERFAPRFLKPIGSSMRYFSDDAYVLAKAKKFKEEGKSTGMLNMIFGGLDKGSIQKIEQGRKSLLSSRKASESIIQAAERAGTEYGTMVNGKFKPYANLGLTRMLINPYSFGFGALAMQHVPVLGLPAQISMKITDPNTYGEKQVDRSSQWYNY